MMGQTPPHGVVFIITGTKRAQKEQRKMKMEDDTSWEIRGDDDEGGEERAWVISLTQTGQVRES